MVRTFEYKGHSVEVSVSTRESGVFVAQAAIQAEREERSSTIPPVMDADQQMAALRARDDARKLIDDSIAS